MDEKAEIWHSWKIMEDLGMTTSHIQIRQTLYINCLEGLQSLRWICMFKALPPKLSFQREGCGTCR